MALRIFKTIATSGFLAALECIKFVFGRGSAPDPLGSLQRSPDVLAGSRGPPSIRKDRAGKVKGKGGKKKERKAENRGTPHFANYWIFTLENALTRLFALLMCKMLSAT